MAGPYVLLVNESHHRCGELRSSHLVLHPDGSYDQVHELLDGSVTRTFAKRWTYQKHVLHLAEFRLLSNDSLRIGENGVDADLQADPARPPVILLPNSKCYYSGPK
jgi:hypothetical protein